MLAGLSRNLIIFFAACFVVAGARASSITASLDRDAIMLGEQATLSLKFDGVQPQTAPNIPSVAGLRFQYYGTSSSINMVGNQASASFSYNYYVTAMHDGEFTIPAMQMKINGEQLTTAQLKLNVSRVGAPSAAAVNSGSEVAFMRLILPGEKMYVGQALTAQLQIYLRDDVQNYGNLQFTGTPADGFMLGKNVGGQRYGSQVGNRGYTVVPISIALTVTKAGTVSLGPFTASMIIVLPSQNQGRDLFSQFFNQGEQKQVTVTTDQIKIQSLPLPDEGKPANFNGAIGDYSLAVTAGPTNVAVGDPITVRVQIAGRGPLDSLKLPDQTGWNEFKLFPPTSKMDFSDQLGLQGTKTFEQIVTPQNSDIHALPEFSFSYFNPDDGKYHALTQPPIALVVKAAGSTPLPTLAGSKNSEEKPSAPELLPIKNDLGTLAQSSPPLISRPVFLAVQTLPVVAFLGTFIWRKRTDNLANNPRLRRQRAVAALVTSGMDDLKKYAAANKPDEFFATLFRLLQEQLGERLDCPASAITENVVEENVILKNAPTALRESLRDQFQLCNQARYAPVRGSAELNSVAAQFQKLINELQNLKA